MAEKTEKRLFKVTKELNVGSDTLVEYLHKHGHKEVKDDLNTKISPEQYELLLKQFAPDKLQKAKADEKKAESKPVVEDLPKTEDNPTPPPIVQEVKKGIEIPKHKVIGKINLEDLRRKPSQKNQPTPEIHKVQVETHVELKQENPVEIKTEAPVELKTETPPVELKTETPAVELKTETPAVELKTETPAVELKKENPVEINAEAPVSPEIIQTPPTITEEEIRPKAEPVIVSKAEPVNLSSEKIEGNTDDSPVKKRIIKKTKSEESTSLETLTRFRKEERKPKENEEILNIEDDLIEDIDVIRASGNVPQLSGLKVIGKIDLDDGKKKKEKKRERVKEKKEKKKDFVLSSSDTESKIRIIKDDDSSEIEKPKDKRSAVIIKKSQLVLNAAAGVEESEEDKKKKRKRKRKKTGAGGTESSGSSNPPPVIHKRGDSKSVKKELINDKEVQKTIRTTLSEMQKGAGRLRQRARRVKRDERAREKEEYDLMEQEQSRVIRITEFITANEFASLLDVPVTEILTKCFQLGLMVSINQRLDAEILNLIASEYDYLVEFIDVKDEVLETEEEEDNPDDVVKRNPVITVMGHVDHGKTTLLDNLRKANVAASEAGGITQHIGAYQVKLKSGDHVTFLDTPGHEAFTAMRARGTKITDVAIIVIAADDAIMPTTREAISHAQAAGVPMVFAINKIDKPGADAQRIRTQLAEMNLLVEDWGGKYQCQEISAKFGTNVDELLERVMLESAYLDLNANPKRHASGSVIESRLDKGRGNVVTILVQNGTLRIGDSLVAGIHSGKVRALINQNGERIKEAGPSMPVQVLGVSGQPQAGDRFQVYTDESRAKSIAQKRQELFREQQLRQTKRITLEEIGRRKLLGNFKELNLIIKGDVDGSVEALSGSMLKLSTEEIAVNIILKGVGQITESDVLLASASDAIIIAFNVRPGNKAKDLAEKEGVNIRTYSIIYQAIDDITQALEGMLSPTIKEDITANVEVRQVFNITKVGNIAGCYISSGKVTKTDKIRVIRDGVVIADSTISALKHYKEDVKEMSGGYECGIQVHHFNDIKVGDTLECYKVTEVKKNVVK